MQALRSRLALLLLLCLTRTLLPEAWVLALHAHAHTTAEPAPARALAGKGKALLSAKHLHCEVEQFYNAAFQPAVPVAMPAPRVAPRYAAPRVGLAVRPVLGQRLPQPALRGPPRYV